MAERIQELQQVMERLDFRWDMGFVDKAEYLAKRSELQNELALMQPIPQSELNEAAELLQNFGARWLAADDAERKRLLHLVVQKLWVKEDKLSAILLRPTSTTWHDRQPTPRLKQMGRSPLRFALKTTQGMSAGAAERQSAAVLMEKK